MTRAPYPSDLTDAQWERLAPLLPPALPGGRPRRVDLRFGAQCHLLPQPPRVCVARPAA